MTETIEQIKEQRVIEHFQIAIGELYKANVSPIIINTLSALLQDMVKEFAEKYPPEEKRKE